MLDLRPSPAASSCRRCGTGLPPLALACPSCAALVHRERLEELAAAATTASASQDHVAARAFWEEARQLVPHGSDQHRVIAERLHALADSARVSAASTPPHGQGRWRVAAGATGIGVLLLGKVKLLIAGLMNLGTLLSMFGFIGVYWSLYGWPLAVGIAGSIYIHEMGHVAMLRRYGISAAAPLFIPGVGAMVMLRERVTDPVVDGRIGLAGPVWGFGAGIAAWLVYQVSGVATWRAIAELTGFLNLFNLIPIWQLDGARGFHPLSTTQRWLIIATSTLCIGLTGARMLWLVVAVGAYRAYREPSGAGHAGVFTTFVLLLAGLTWLARHVS